MADMWRLVRWGGKLAATTWGPGLFEPGNSIFWDAVRELAREPCKAVNPLGEVTTPAALQSLFTRAGIERSACEAVPGRHRLDAPKDFWDVVLGSGYRATVNATRAHLRFTNGR